MFTLGYQAIGNPPRYRTGWLVRWHVDCGFRVADLDAGAMPSPTTSGAALAVGYTRTGAHLFLPSSCPIDPAEDRRYVELAKDRGWWDEFPLDGGVPVVLQPGGEVYQRAHMLVRLLQEQRS